MSEIQIQPVIHKDHRKKYVPSLSPLNINSNFIYDYTLSSNISFSGIGLHTGKHINVKLIPAPAGTGIVFQRSDLNHVSIPANYSNVIDTTLNTMIACPSNSKIRISTIEHLMAALAGNQINNIIIECDGPELPILDGAASQYVSFLKKAGLLKLTTKAKAIKILKPVRIQLDDSFAELRPTVHNNFVLSLFIDFPDKIVGQQHYSMTLSPINFNNNIAHCRTFTFKEEIDTLRKMGLAKGGSLDNAIVVENNQVVNPTGLKCKNEFVKHKMLDAIGDLALINAKIEGKFIGYKSGHKINNLLLRKLMADKNSWCYL